MGNLTYGLSILCHSMEREYIMTNLPWLIGSLGTIAEDVIIFVQFKLYNSSKPKPSTMVWFTHTNAWLDVCWEARLDD